MRAPKKGSAAERTISIPGVSLSEEEDQNQIAIVGPLLRKVSVDGLGDFSHPHATHLVRVDAVARGPLCGADLRGRPESNQHQKVCGLCRIQASILQGVVK